MDSGKVHGAAYRSTCRTDAVDTQLALPEAGLTQAGMLVGVSSSAALADWATVVVALNKPPKSERAFLRERSKWLELTSNGGCCQDSSAPSLVDDVGRAYLAVDEKAAVHGSARNAAKARIATMIILVVVCIVYMATTI